MLLTAAWAGSLAIGKCDLNAHGEAIEGSGYGKTSCNKQVLRHFYYVCSLSVKIAAAIVQVSQMPVRVCCKGV